MPTKILDLKTKDNKGMLKNTGRIEIKNETNKSAELYFYGDIVSSKWEKWDKEDKMPSDVKDFLAPLSNLKTLYVHINSGGGSVTGGIAIGNMIKQFKAHTICYVDAIAASIATVIALSCDEVHLYTNSIFMIHKPLTIAMGNADDMRKTADVLDTCQKCILATYMAKAKEGVSEDDIMEKIDAETWFTGAEAAEYFDVVVEEGMEEAVAAADSNILNYSHMPEKIKNLLNDVHHRIPNCAQVGDDKKELIDDMVAAIKSNVFEPLEELANKILDAVQTEEEEEEEKPEEEKTEEEEEQEEEGAEEEKEEEEETEEEETEEEPEKETEEDEPEEEEEQEEEEETEEEEEEEDEETEKKKTEEEEKEDILKDLDFFI